MSKAKRTLTRRRITKRSNVRFRAGLEKLEDRRLLATVTFDSPSTNGGDGVWVLQQRQATDVHIGSAYLYYNVNLGSSFPNFTTGDTLYAKVNYYDEGSATLKVQYDSLAENFDLTEYHTRSTVVNSQQFVSSYHVLSNVQFANGTNGNDLRVNTAGVPISTVEISDQPFADSGLEWVDDMPWLRSYVGPSRDDVDASTLTGKIISGYQGWFETPNDPRDIGYRHWGQPGDWDVEQWPDPNDYDPSELFAVPGVTTASGDQAYLFSSNNASVVGRHFQWMRQHNLDGVLLQRFSESFMTRNADGSFSGKNQWPLVNVREAAHREGRTWAIEYDIQSGANEAERDVMIQKVKDDWEFLTDPSGFNMLADSRYQREGGKPVVAIFGLYLSDDRGYTTSQQEDLVNYFKSRGIYVIGAGRHSESLSQTTNAGLHDAYIPWQGYWKGGNSFVPADERLDGVTEHIPHVFPGFSWTHLKEDSNATSRDREDGAFYWRMLSDAVNETDAPWFFIGMFDEYDEATNLIPASDDPPLPDNDADGIPLTFQTSDPMPNDWWMALTGQAKEALLAKTTITDTVPTKSDLENRSNVGGEVVWQPFQSDRLSRVEIPNDSNVHFQVDDSFLFQETDGRDVTVEVEYLDSSTGTFSLIYDSLSQADQSSSPVPLTGSGKWRTHRFELADARFGNHQNGANDFRLEKSSGALTVRRVRVIKESMLAAESKLGVSNTTNGLQQLEQADGQTFSTTNGGRDGRVLTGASDSLYIYFRLDDDFAHDVNAGLNAIIEVVYHDVGSGSLRVQYDSTTAAYKNSDSVAMENTNEWRTARFYLDDALFGNRQNGASDFRITGSNIPIDRVRLLHSFGDRIAPQLQTAAATVDESFDTITATWSISDDWKTGSMDRWTPQEDNRVRIEWSNDNGASWNFIDEIFEQDSSTFLSSYDTTTGTSHWSGQTALSTESLDAGTYQIRITPIDASGNIGNAIIVNDVELPATTATVVMRGIACGDATAAYGENAIDSTKTAYRGSSTTSTTAANYTNYIKGLNRVVVDLANSRQTTLTTADFVFRIGNSDDLSAWTELGSDSEIPLPTIINGIRDIGTGVQRFTLAWDDTTKPAIKNQWLQVTITANQNTGLTEDDVFYFGNQVADVDGSASASASGRVTVNAFDVLDIRFNQSPSQNSVGIGHVYDIDRSGSVNAFDVLDARFNQMPTGGLMMITLPPALPSITLQQNSSNRFDVNGDGRVTAVDALIGINYLNSTNVAGERIGSSEQASLGMYFYDVNGDGRTTALDSLQIINALGIESPRNLDEPFPPPQLLSPSGDDEFDWIAEKSIAAEAVFDEALKDWPLDSSL